MKLAVAFGGLFGACLLSASAQATTLFSEDFSGATPGTYGVGAIPGTKFDVSTLNVDVLGVLNGSLFSCVDNPSGNCVDLVGNSGGGGIASTSGVTLDAGTTYTVSFGSNLQGYDTTDVAETTFTVGLGDQTSLQTLTAAEGDHQFDVSFTPLVNETDALLSFTTDTAPDGVHGAVIDNVLVTGAPSVSAAPEPSTWALMLAGVGLAGGALRFGRRSVQATAAA